MKKIGLVTFFNSYNYGVWFQAFATEYFLLQHQYDVEIVNYSNKYDREKLKYFYKERGRIGGYISSFFKSLIFGKVRYYNRGFKNNLDVFYRLSKKRFTQVGGMEKLEYDVLIAGSDQIWNPETTGGRLDRVFLLDFGKTKKRISYASSIGSSLIRDQDKYTFTETLKKFCAISVRENFAAEQLQSLITTPIKVVCDPTFLLRKRDWLEFDGKYSTIKKVDKKYILTYFVSGDKYTDRYIDLVKAYSKKMGLPVWAIQFSSYYNKACDRKILGASIADFIELLNDAEIMITDSFHGVALSINLNKNFVVLENKKNPARIQNLLEMLDLEQRIDMPVKKLSRIDYECVNKKVEEIRLESSNWLLNKIEA